MRKKVYKYLIFPFFGKQLTFEIINKLQRQIKILMALNPNTKKQRSSVAWEWHDVKHSLDDIFALHNCLKYINCCI